MVVTMGHSSIEKITRESIGDLTESNLNSIHNAAHGMRTYLRHLLQEALDADAGRRREALEESFRRSEELRRG